MSTEINVLALVKGNERYVFLFDDENRVETLRQIGRYAANPDLSFTWYDAAVMSQKIRQATQRPAPSADPNVSARFHLPLPLDNGWEFGDHEAA